MRLWKLTDRTYRTMNATQWGEGVTHRASGLGDLCGPGWLHAYLSPELAVLLNPIHAAINAPILWECEGDVGKRDHDLKVGCTRLTTLRRVPLPACSIEQRVTFAILCALVVYDEPSFVDWAHGWLDGSDRTDRTDPVAAAALETAARARAEAWAATAEAWATTAAATGKPDLVALATQAIGGFVAS